MFAFLKTSVKDKYHLTLLFFILLFIIYFTIVAFARHDNLYSRRLDLGNMDQTVWNVVHGNGFTLTHSLNDKQASRLAAHADFLLILLAPFYLIWSNPKTLILIQTIVLGLGAIPIYWIAFDKLKSKKLALLFAGAFLLYPPMQRTILFDFHAVVLATTFLLFAYWFMYKEKYCFFIIFAVLAAITKEEVWLITGLMGLYIIFFKKRLWVGLITAVISFSIFYLLLWKFIPALATERQHFALVYFSEFGDNQNLIIKNILINPFSVFSKIFSYDRLFYYYQLLLPAGLLSLFSPLKLIFSFPGLLINTLSNNPLMRQLDYQYNSTICPFVFISAIDGFLFLQNLSLKLRKRYQIINVIGIMAFSMTIIYSSYSWGELPIGPFSRFGLFLTPQPEKDLVLSLSRKIDAKYSVSVTNNIGAHFSQRQFVYNFPINAQKADFVFIKLKDPNSWPNAEEQEKALTSLLKNVNYELFAQQGDFYAFRKRGIKS
ncbi:MAG: DUF2079 domain-containing protein [Candidatus Gottesmanbacteria bacterium]